MRIHRYRAWDSYQNKMYSWEEIGKMDEAGHLSLWNLLTGAIDHIKPMESTGLLDKNGVEIFEGDIVSYGLFALNDVAKYGPSAWNNLPEGVSKNDISTVLSRHEVHLDIIALHALKQAIDNNPDVNGVEVIGNIHENPALLND